MISAELGRSLESHIADLVATGHCGSRSEVLREDVRLILDREAPLPSLDALIEKGIADAQAGRGQQAVDVFDCLEKKYQAMLNDNG